MSILQANFVYELNWIRCKIKLSLDNHIKHSSINER